MRWWREVLVSVGSAVAAGMLAQVVAPTLVVVGAMTILIIHEFGHYVTARLLDVEVTLPIFIGLVVAVVGVTRTRGASPAARRIIAVAGPIAGLYAALSVLVGGIVGGVPLIALIGAVGAVFELYAVTVGRDGRLFRGVDVHAC